MSDILPTPSGITWEGFELWRHSSRLVLDYMRGGVHVRLEVAEADPDSARPCGAVLKLRESDGEEAVTATVDVRGVNEADALERLSAVLRRSVRFGREWFGGGVTSEGVLR